MNTQSLHQLTLRVEFSTPNPSRTSLRPYKVWKDFKRNSENRNPIHFLKLRQHATQEHTHKHIKLWWVFDRLEQKRGENILPLSTLSFPLIPAATCSPSPPFLLDLSKLHTPSLSLGSSISCPPFSLFSSHFKLFLLVLIRNSSPQVLGKPRTGFKWKWLKSPYFQT